MTDAKRLQPDITLLLDMDGVIREATVSHNMPESSVTAWLGQQWISTVGDVGGEKVKRMVDDARSAGVSAFRQINQRFPSGMEIPMEYTTVLLGGKAGLLAIGKSLQSVAELQARFVAAQQALERDYWKLREVETRYRQLFQASNEAVILVGATDLRIVEANPAALEALGYAAQKPQSATGRGFVEELAVGEREAFMGMLARVREQGKAPGLLVHLGRDKKSWMARASLLAPHPESVFLLHLSPIGLPQAGAVSAATISIDDMVERMPDGFIVVDQEGVIRRANRAFLDLVEVGAKGSVIGERIGRWLWQPHHVAGCRPPTVKHDRRQRSSLRARIHNRENWQDAAAGPGPRNRERGRAALCQGSARSGRRKQDRGSRASWSEPAKPLCQAKPVRHRKFVGADCRRLNGNNGTCTRIQL